jgi:hypothetical protein
MAEESAVHPATVEVWKEAVQVQMHFNQLLIRLRALLASVILALSGAASFIGKVADAGLRVRESALLVAIGFVAAQFLLDFFYYTRLLLGAVDFTTRLDKQRAMGDLSGLTEGITRATPRRHTLRVILAYYVILVLMLFAALFHIRGRVCLSYCFWISALIIFIAGAVSYYVSAKDRRPGSKSPPAGAQNPLAG